MKNIYYKFKSWYRGENKPVSLEQILNLVNNNRRFLETKESSVSDILKPPLTARILNSIGRFCLRRYEFIIVTILAIIGLYIAWKQLP